jgi:hypothetical protein
MSGQKEEEEMSFKYVRDEKRAKIKHTASPLRPRASPSNSPRFDFVKVELNKSAMSREFFFPSFVPDMRSTISSPTKTMS